MRRRINAATALAIAAVAAMTLAGVPAARADVVDEAWKRGNDAFFSRRYDDAVTAYEQLERQGVVSADLAFNLGCAYFRQGRLGPAIWALERAVALDPDSEDARFNLEQARKLAERRARDRIEGADRDPAWIRAVTALPPSTETWLFLGLYVGAFGLLFAWRRAGGAARVTLGAGAALVGVAALAAGILLAGRAALDRLPFGVVLPDTLAVKEGADPNYRTSFDLHAGLRVRVQEHDGSWLRIRLPNGLEGWVRDKDIGKL